MINIVDVAWWTQAVFYEIYIRSFQDSNDDGIGDLNGITARLDYLADLGIDALWITPFYPSPQVDFGYDVSNYEDVDPQFGTLADFDRLIARAHARGIRVVVDIVLNHTSDHHPWFQAARSARTSPYRDWYVWHDGRSGGPPNNWESAFGGPAWTFDAGSGQWYYHCFYPQQPDLNWRNRAVEERMFATVKFWLDRGVKGFRLDAANTLFEDPSWRDNPLLPEPTVTLTGVRTQEFAHTRRLPEVFGVLSRLRAFVERHAPDAVLISEAYVDDVDDLMRFYDAGRMHLPFNFFLAQVPSLDAAAFRDIVDRVEGACGERWPSLVLSNHDIDRAADRLAGSDSDAAAMLLAILLLTLRGTPFIYYGEEIGMRTVPPLHLDEVRDPVGRRFWPGYKGRDGERRPMQWTPGSGGGFTGGRPWLALAPDAAERHVQQQMQAPGSTLSAYRTLLRLRRTSDALRRGSYRSLTSEPGVFAYERRSAGQRVIAVLNMTNEPCHAGVPELADGSWHTLFGTHWTADVPAPRALELAPFEGLVLSEMPET